jgi:hypothetical protein
VKSTRSTIIAIILGALVAVFYLATALPAEALGHHHAATVGPDGKVIPAPTVAAPEIDPAGTASAVTLLVGALLVVLGRRRNRGNSSK